MNQDLKIIFHGTPNANPQLRHRIISEIAAREARRDLIRMRALSAIGIVAGLGTIPAVIELATRASASGSFQYLSLAFTGGLTTASHDMLLAFLESLPIVSLLICLAIIAIALWSARAAFKQNKALSFSTV